MRVTSPLLTAAAAARAELPVAGGGGAEAGDPAAAATAAHRPGPAAGVWRCGPAHPSVPVVQERRAHSHGYQEETPGEFDPHCLVLS